MAAPGSERAKEIADEAMTLAHCACVRNPAGRPWKVRSNPINAPIATAITDPNKYFDSAEL
jgi:hypothetical protein